MTKPHVVHGSPGSGSVPIEAALTLIGIPYLRERAKKFDNLAAYVDRMMAQYYPEFV
jgi:hypothetical protein